MRAAKSEKTGATLHHRCSRRTRRGRLSISLLCRSKQHAVSRSVSGKTVKHIGYFKACSLQLLPYDYNVVVNGYYNV